MPMIPATVSIVNGVPSVSPPTVVVPHQGLTTLQFTLSAAQGYVFPPTTANPGQSAIVITNPPNNGQFTVNRITDTEVHVTDQDTALGTTYEYTVYVQTPGGTIIEKDPQIENER